MLLASFIFKSLNGCGWEGRIARTSYHEGVIPTIRANCAFILLRFAKVDALVEVRCVELHAKESYSG